MTLLSFLSSVPLSEVTIYLKVWSSKDFLRTLTDDPSSRCYSDTHHFWVHPPRHSHIRAPRRVCRVLELPLGPRARRRRNTQPPPNPHSNFSCLKAIRILPKEIKFVLKYLYWKKFDEVNLTLRGWVGRVRRTGGGRGIPSCSTPSHERSRLEPSSTSDVNPRTVPPITESAMWRLLTSETIDTKTRKA